MVYKACLANKLSLKLRSQYSEACKAAATKVKLSKERAWKEFGQKLDHGSSTRAISAFRGAILPFRRAISDLALSLLTEQPIEINSDLMATYSMNCRKSGSADVKTSDVVPNFLRCVTLYNLKN